MLQDLKATEHLECTATIHALVLAPTREMVRQLAGIWKSTRPPWPTARAECFARQCRQWGQGAGVGGEDGQHVHLPRCRQRV
jgi:hypothetical protein